MGVFVPGVRSARGTSPRFDSTFVESALPVLFPVGFLLDHFPFPPACMPRAIPLGSIRIDRARIEPVVSNQDGFVALGPTDGHVLVPRVR